MGFLPSFLSNEQQLNFKFLRGGIINQLQISTEREGGGRERKKGDAEQLYKEGRQSENSILVKEPKLLRMNIQKRDAPIQASIIHLFSLLPSV